MVLDAKFYKARKERKKESSTKRLTKLRRAFPVAGFCVTKEKANERKLLHVNPFGSSQLTQKEKKNVSHGVFFFFFFFFFSKNKYTMQHTY